MPRREICVVIEASVVDDLDVKATAMCVSRSTMLEALARADTAGDVANLGTHVAVVASAVKDAERQRGRQVAALGREARTARKKTSKT